MNRSLNIPCALALACLLLVSACVAPGPETGGATNANAPATQPTPAASGATNSAREESLPVTLPVLDAMFTDESFAGELKSRLQLSDEQITRLRQVAREATAGLGEKDDSERSTARATENATAKIREVLGQEKSAQLFAFVRERWAGGEGAEFALSSKPNAVPTDTRIVVNAPAYRMDVFEDGRLVKTYRIGIGYPEFPLPQGLRRADTVIFNPTWTPPDEPWVRGEVSPGKTVEAGSKLNPLGVVKIPIGLPSLIHGGKNAAQLGSFASHGCVGMTNVQVQDFSLMLARIGGAQLTPEEIKTFEKQKTETKNVKLGDPIPVELRYETIVVEDGRLRIFRDVYDRGTNTEENLRAVLEVYGVRLEDLNEQERAQVSEALRAMARDARGNPADGQATPTPTPSNSNSNSNRAPQRTRTIKGEKEMTVEIAALRGKGYPAPINLDTGGQKQQKKPAAQSQSRTRT